MKFFFVVSAFILLTLSKAHAGGIHDLVERKPTIRIITPSPDVLANPKDLEISWEILESTDEFLGFVLENTATQKRTFLTDAHKVRYKRISKLGRIEPGNYRIIGYHYGMNQAYSEAGISETFQLNYTYEPFWTTEEHAAKICPIFSGLDNFYTVDTKTLTCGDRSCNGPKFYSYIFDTWIIYGNQSHRLPPNKEIVQVQCIPHQ